MKIIVPEDIGGELEVLPEGKCHAVIADMFYGLSDKNQPKITVKWQLTTDITGDDGEEYEASGKNVLDTYSLQPQALWRLNSLYKAVKEEDIPKADYEPQEFVNMISEALKGEEFALVLFTDNYGGEDRTKVEKASYVG